MAEENPQAKAKTVAVIGAGIVGVATAVWLQRDGFDVVLIDKAGPAEGTSYGNAGVLASCSIVPVTVPGLMMKAPGMVFDPMSPLFLKWGYVPRLMPWLMRYMANATVKANRRVATALTALLADSLEQHQALAAGTPAEKWIVPSDYVFVYTDRATYEGDAYGWGLRKEFGFTWDELDTPAFRDYDPAFGAGYDFAARVPGHGYVTDPGRHVKDLAAHVVASGGRLVKAEARDVAYENGVVVGVDTDQGLVAADRVVVATGAWSKPLVARLGLDVPLETERGYHIELVEPSVTPRSPVMVASGKFVATPMDGRLRCAGIVEFGGLEAAPSKAPFDLLLRRITEALPELKYKDVVQWMGHRPAPSDSIPLIGEVPGKPGVYLGFGHHHVGLTGGAKTGRLIADMIAGRKPNIDLSFYDPARFAA